MYERIINLIGDEQFNKIKSKKVLLVGIGGVGSFTYTALIRSGFQNITVIDHDIVEETNLNRQLIATLSTLGEEKIAIAKEMAENINKEITINGLNMFLNDENIDDLDKDFDYIIDACDTLKTKVALIKFAIENNIKIISAMGLGNRLQAKKVILTTLDKTKNDPLAKKLRKTLRDEKINIKIPVVTSEELPYKKGEVNSLITSPGVAGLLLADYVINDILNLY